MTTNLPAPHHTSSQATFAASSRGGLSADGPPSLPGRTLLLFLLAAFVRSIVGVRKNVCQDLGVADNLRNDFGSLLLYASGNKYLAYAVQGNAWVTVAKAISPVAGQADRLTNTGADDNVNADGGGLTQLTNNTVDDGFAVWAP